MSFDVQRRVVTVFRVRSTGRADFSPSPDQWTRQNMEDQHRFGLMAGIRRAPARRHRLRSNPPVRLAPKADAGSCSSLQFFHKAGRIDGATGRVRKSCEEMTYASY